jgi:hypothetical protein
MYPGHATRHMLGRPLPRTQRNRGFTIYVDSFGCTHQRRPYGRPSHGSVATTTITQPSPIRFPSMPTEDNIETDEDTQPIDCSGISDAICSAQEASSECRSTVATGASVHPSSHTPPSCTRDRLSRLIALSRFMHHNGGGVLAVQQTRIRQKIEYFEHDAGS